jgi:nucleoside-diphosphate-sugar epimerase
MNKVLVSGSAGFIGQRVAQMLLEQGVAVVGIDNINNYYDVSLKNYRLKQLERFDNFKFYKSDIESYKDLAEIFQNHKFDAILNLAARAGVRYSIKNPYIYLSTNVGGTLNLLELAAKYQIKNFVLASTSSLYAGSNTPFSEDLAVNKPISPYAASKKAAESLAYTYHYLYGLDVTILRYFTVYGPAGRPDMAPLRFIKWIDEGQPLIVYGDGNQSRDFTYIDDIAAGTIKAYQNNQGYRIINLGNNKPFSLKVLIRLIEDKLGKKAKIENKPSAKADMRATWADITRAKELLDWQPKVSLEEGIEKTITWHRENAELVESLRIKR